MIWKATRKQFLYKEGISGRYYSRLYRDGKSSFQSLGTTVFSVAEARLAEKIKDLKSEKKTTKNLDLGKATVADIALVFMESESRRPDLKSSTIHYRQQCIDAILSVWPELKTLQPKHVTETHCERWAQLHAAKYSPTRYNNAVDTLRKIFEVAIDRGLIYRNPAADLGKRTPDGKPLEVLSTQEFSKIVESVRNEGAWCSQQCSDLIEFLAFTGCRITEAKNVRWDDIKADGIWIHGDETGTKNKESRFLPMNARLEALINELRANPRYRRAQRDEAYLLAVSECQKAIDSAIKRLNAKAAESGLPGIKRFTHHDLRHLFATRAIESGIDVPTVSKWLGHKDGGALLMKTYSHLLQEHSKAMAAKLVF
jgi:integrase